MFIVRKILIMSAFFPPKVGDDARFTYFLARELAFLGVEVKVISTCISKAVIKKKIDGIEVIFLPSFRVGERFSLLKSKSYKLIYDILSKFKPDCVIVNDYYRKLSFLGVKAASSLGFHSILINHLTCHVKFKNRIAKSLFALYEHRMLEKIRKLPVVFAGTSKAQIDWLKKFSVNARFEITDAVDINAIALPGMRRKLGISHDVILFSAAQSEISCELELIIKAFNSVNFWNGPKMTLVIYKKSSLNKKFASDNVIFAGDLAKEDILSLLDASDVFIHFNKLGARLSADLLYAGTYSCAVLLVDDGSGCQVVNDKKLGLIVPFDDINKLKEALQRLRLHTELRGKLGESLQSRVELKFSWSQSALALIDAVCELNGSRK